ncbi:hypothetical protein BKG89_00475 [Rodentibacter caecimuris]|uniref:Putative sugar diacid recognition domain-containing protein n=1 Tax=Rodentibacter caecimuris TaxID=1796644 RepID=A0ABX3L0Q9_9PAST|nr:hypothetical protein BKG89_00475 [Rodentibacter heylii]
MQLDTTIAQKIVKRAMQIIHYSVNVMNDDGVIIASGNPQRLSQRHTGAVLALRENRVVEVDRLLAQNGILKLNQGLIYLFPARKEPNIPPRIPEPMTNDVDLFFHISLSKISATANL